MKKNVVEKELTHLDCGISSSDSLVEAHSERSIRPVAVFATVKHSERVKAR